MTFSEIIARYTKSTNDIYIDPLEISVRLHSTPPETLSRNLGVSDELNK